MLRPMILVSEYEKGVLKNIQKLYPRSFDGAKERVEQEITKLQQENAKAKVTRTAQQVAVIDIDHKQRVKIEIVERF